MRHLYCRCFFSKWASLSRNSLTNYNHFNVFIFIHSQSSCSVPVLPRKFLEKELFKCSWWQNSNRKPLKTKTKQNKNPRTLMLSNHLPSTVTWGKLTWRWSWRVNPTIRHLCPDGERNVFPPKRNRFLSIQDLFHLPECPLMKQNLIFHLRVHL